MKFSIPFFAAVSFLFSNPVLARESLHGPHVEISWLAPNAFGAGSSENIAIRYDLEPQWHIYWKNPGDSGAAPKFRFQADGAVLGPIQWPYPHRMPFAHLINLGYERRTAFPFLVTPEAGAKFLRIEAKLEWLVCKEECIPGFGTLTLERPVAASSDWTAADRDLVAGFLDKVPRADNSPWRISELKLEPETLRVHFQSAQAGGKAPEAYPVNGAFLKPQEPASEKTAGGFHMIFSRIPGAPVPEEISFVIVENEKSWELSKPLKRKTDLSLLLLLTLAFLGGVLLNLMPCVLPVLSIKLLSLIKESREERWKEAWLYSLGVCCTFAALGAAVLVLRAAGAAVGWGFQLQSPAMVLGLILLFWLLALNFLGVFEMGTSLMNMAGRSKSTGAFATGVLSVFVAAPCTGPFMGTALGAAAVLPGWQAMGIFLALGFGLSFPFVLFALVPGLLRKVPKPGAWMETFKQFLAFPMFATVLWLLWVLGLQTGHDGWLASGILLFLISFSIWLGRSRKKVFQIAAWVLATLTVVLSFQKIRTLRYEQTISTESEWKKFDPRGIEKARAEGRAVFVDFTAAWCITCQVNKKAVLETEGARKLFQEKNVLLMRADWTKHDPVITKALSDFGRNSVPLYVFYPRDGTSAQILPQLLTLSMIENILAGTKEVPK